MSKKTKLFYILAFFLFSIVTFTNVVNAQSLIGNPTSNNRETSPFGWRESTGTNHLAVDYGATNAGVAGDPVVSTISGKVVESRYQTNAKKTGGWGNTVLIESNSGNYQVRYSHMDQAGLPIGTSVTPGQNVGIMGGTGREGGYAVHLDYAVMVKNPDTGLFQPVDPNMAIGRNLDDPDVARQLISDAEGKISGALKSSGAPVTTTGITIDDTGGSDQCPIGCDCSLLEQNETIIDAVNQVNAEISKANITQPTAIEQLTCADQQQALLSEAGGIHSDTISGDLSGSLFGPLAQKPLQQQFENILEVVNNGLSLNPITNLITSSFNDIASSFLGSLAGTNTASSNTNCDMIEQTWLINQCIEMPQLPSLTDILGGKVAEITGAVGSLANPDRLIKQVCEAANSKINGLNSNVDRAFNDAAGVLSNPITDTIN